MTIPLALIKRLEVSAGTGSRVARGMGLGLLAGAAIGAVWGSATYDARCGCGIPLSRGGSEVLDGLGGALIGLVAGGFIGAGLETEHWKRVAVTARPVSARFGPSGKIGLMMSAKF